MTQRRMHNPFKGKPGLGNRINAALFPIIGPAQLGSGGSPEVADTSRPAAKCHRCGISYDEHVIRRGSGPTQSSSIICPDLD